MKRPLLEGKSCPKLTHSSSRKAVEVLRKDLAKTRGADLRVGATKPVTVEYVKHLEVQAEPIALGEP